MEIWPWKIVAQCVLSTTLALTPLPVGLLTALPLPNNTSILGYLIAIDALCLYALTHRSVWRGWYNGELFYVRIIMSSEAIESFKGPEAAVWAWKHLWSPDSTNQKTQLRIIDTVSRIPTWHSNA